MGEIGGRTRAEQAQKTLGSPAQALSEEIEFENLYTPEVGLNWTDLGAITANILAIEYLGNGIVVLSDTGHHVFRSTDYGLNWTDLGVVAIDQMAAIEYLGNGIVVLGDDAGHIYRSTDYGLTWTDLGVVSATNIEAIQYLGNGIVIFGDFANHVFRSTDYGATWADLLVITADGCPVMEYLGNGIVILGDWLGHVFRSTDYGATWADLGVVATNTAYITTIEYLGNGIVVLMDGAHIWRSTDYGLTWTDLGAIAGADLSGIQYLGNGIVVFGDGANHVFRSTDYGLTWTDLGVVTTNFAYRTKYLGNGIVLLTDEGHIWRSAPSCAVSINPLPEQIRQSVCKATDPSGSLGRLVRDSIVGNVEHYEKLYPLPDGEGSVSPLVTLSSDADDTSDAALTTQWYYGEPKAIVPVDIGGDFALDEWRLIGIVLNAEHADIDFKWELLRAVKTTESNRTAGNLWDEGETVLTLGAGEGANFEDDDLVWITSDDYPDGEIVRVSIPPVGDVVTIEREATFGMANPIGLRWVHATNPKAYLCRRPSDGYRRIHGVLAVATTKPTFTERFHAPRVLQANDGIIARIINTSDSVNDRQLNLSVLYDRGEVIG